MLVVSAAVPVRVISILSALSISQVPVRLVCHAASRIANYYVLRGCSRRCERAVRDEGRHVQQKAVEVPSVVPQFLKMSYVSCTTRSVIQGRHQTLVCVEMLRKVCIMQ